MGEALCECGCGAPAPLARKTSARMGHIKGQPIRFIHSHHLRTIDQAYKHRPATPESNRRRAMTLRGTRLAEGNPNWRGGTSSALEVLRRSSAFREWRKAVYARDDYTCRECGARGGRLHAHHVDGFAHHPERRFDVDNGLTLCESCHRQTTNFGSRSRTAI